MQEGRGWPIRFLSESWLDADSRDGGEVRARASQRRALGSNKSTIASRRQSLGTDQPDPLPPTLH